MSVYTCIACRVVFADGETQRSHYKTDWHRYNLKRKVAELPPVSADNFRQRVLGAQQTPVVAEDKQALKCGVCGKNFNSQNALQNHLQSKKHKEAEVKEAQRRQKEVEKINEKNKEKGIEVQPENNEKLEKDVANREMKEKLGNAASGNELGATGGADDEEMEDADTDSEVESVDSFGDEDGLGIEECLFCSHISQSLFVDTDSEVESVDSFGDEDGLGIEECLFCSHISPSLEENMKHMTVKHSFFLPDADYISDLEGLVTYLGQKVGLGNVCLWCNEKGKRFYTTEAVQKHMIDKGHCKILHEGDVILEYADFYDYRSSYPDHNPEEEDRETEEEMEVDVSPDVLAAEGYELVLPSGATIGHRSLHKYYKQNINPRSGERTKSVLPKMLAQYKALGWTGATGVVAKQRCKDLAAVQRMKNRVRMQLGTKANKFQPHYRPQVIF
ncbi:cytoplasmic 60S subunit biogenesis factor ZNF622-like isoform X2 [Mercenaria mercenaria]|uniref:cytoplasmic 60S subunit biogenesis factor ZNF622-like isoform X2 n=1 Tax=Mercenaria mercenaria TaxID=6596 RepID=UPI00234E5926|nr:cytoplasmic 60S subunit biogenesis factor ZNF622-like isoform X2 [Mercenaria mercenaria]